MTDFILWCILILLAMSLVFAIASGKFSNRRSGIATLTVFHDFQSKDKQEAVEVIVEEKAGKKMEEQESGKNKKPTEGFPLNDQEQKRDNYELQ